MICLYLPKLQQSNFVTLFMISPSNCGVGVESKRGDVVSVKKAIDYNIDNTTNNNHHHNL